MNRKDSYLTEELILVFFIKVLYYQATYYMWYFYVKLYIERL